MDKFRGFIAIEVPITDQILRFQEDIKKTSAQVKLVEPENIHITLKFLGDTPINQIESIESIIKNAISSTKKHIIRLEGTGVFPNENYIKVIWIGIKDTDLIAQIAESINTQCSTIGFQKDKRGFSAHLTIGRLKSSTGKEQIVDVLNSYKDTLFSEIVVNEIHLKKSTLTPKGPIYETLSTIPLTD
jgi:RNA 2',3'-cyclic 3'-phosphodiesterase